MPQLTITRLVNAAKAVVEMLTAKTPPTCHDLEKAAEHLDYAVGKATDPDPCYMVTNRQTLLGWLHALNKQDEAEGLLYTDFAPHRSLELHGETWIDSQGRLQINFKMPR